MSFDITATTTANIHLIIPFTIFTSKYESRMMWGRMEGESLKWSRRGRLGLPLPPEDQDDFEDFEDFDGGDGDGEDHDEE